MEKADKITMIFRLLLSSILLSPLLTSAEVKRPSYCEVLDKMYDYDFRKELAKNKDQVFQNCVGIDNKVINFDDLLDNAYSINKAVHQQESIEFKHKLRDTLVKKNYESMLKYTNIPGLSLSAKHTNGITSCLGFDNTKLNLKDEEGATETFVYRNFQLAYQAKGIIHTLKKAREEFNAVTEKYLKFKAQEFREQRLNRTGVVDKNSVFNLHVRKTFEKAKREYEKKVSFHQAKLFRLVKSEPWLFDVGRNWSPSNFLDKEIKLSSIGERFVSKMPKTLS